MYSLPSGVLFHKTNPHKQLNWRVVANFTDVVLVLDTVECGNVIHTTNIRIPPSESTADKLGKYIGGFIKEVCKDHDCTPDKPEYTQQIKVPWTIEKHVGSQVQVVYEINGVELKEMLTIPGTDGTITEELVKIAIDNAVKAAAKKRRFTGMKGEVTLPLQKGEEKVVVDKKDLPT